MRAVGYARVSTNRQAERGFGLEVQERAVRDYCAANGLRLLRIERDEGVSGTNGLEARVGLPAALLALERGDAEALVVARLDRLARRLALQEAVLADAWEAGAEVHEVGAGRLDPDDEDRVFYRQVMGAVAQLDLAKTKRRLRDGRAAKIARDGWAGGVPRYGLRLERSEGTRAGVLVEDETEQRAIRLARQLRRDGKTLETIGDRLRVSGFVPKRGGAWHPRTVQRLLGEGREKRHTDRRRQMTEKGPAPC